MSSFELTFYRCDFKPILQKRLDSFQSALYRNYWSKLRERQAEGMTPASLARASKISSPFMWLKNELVELSKHKETAEWYRPEKMKPLEPKAVEKKIEGIQRRYGWKTGVKGGWSALATVELKARVRGERKTDKRTAAKQGGTDEFKTRVRGGTKTDKRTAAKQGGTAQKRRRRCIL